MKTIARNRKNLINEIFASVTLCVSHSRDDGYQGIPCDAKYARIDLDASHNARLYDDGNGKYTVHVHSAHWYRLDTNERPVSAVVEEPVAESAVSASVIYIDSEEAQSVAGEQVVEAVQDHFVYSDFAILNKNNSLDEYKREVEEGRSRCQLCKVTHVATLTASQWLSFTNNLLSDMDWLADKGGSDSSADLPEVANFWEYTPEQQVEWRKHSYLLVVEVRCEGQESIYVDPQGYNYARYVGLNGTPVAIAEEAASISESKEVQVARTQLDSSDMVTLPGTIVEIRATEAAADIAQICHALRVEFSIPQRVYFAKGLGNLANEWLLERCDNGAMVKEVPDGSDLSLYEPYWKLLEASESEGVSMVAVEDATDYPYGLPEHDPSRVYARIEHSGPRGEDEFEQDITHAKAAGWRQEQSSVLTVSGWETLMSRPRKED